MDVLRSCGNDAAILTGISLATAFGLLVAMMLIIVAVRLVSTRLPSPPGDDTETRNRAAAAVTAVTALLADPNRARSRERASADGDE